VDVDELFELGVHLGEQGTDVTGLAGELAVGYDRHCFGAASTELADSFGVTTIGYVFE
jgi:hypothetical protein